MAILVGSGPLNVLIQDIGYCVSPDGFAPISIRYT
jgi:hypothetical protein